MILDFSTFGKALVAWLSLQVQKECLFGYLRQQQTWPVLATIKQRARGWGIIIFIYFMVSKIPISYNENATPCAILSIIALTHRPVIDSNNIFLYSITLLNAHQNLNITLCYLSSTCLQLFCNIKCWNLNIFSLLMELRLYTRLQWQYIYLTIFNVLKTIENR